MTLSKPKPKVTTVVAVFSLALLSTTPAVAESDGATLALSPRGSTQPPVPPPNATPVIIPSPREVPTGNFAYEAIRTLTRQGYLEGFPRDTDPFHGNTVTRYEMASLVARIASYTQQRLHQRSTNPSITVPAENIDLVRRLVDEFRLELAVIGIDLAQLNRDLPEIAGGSKPQTSGTTPSGASPSGSKDLAQLVVVPERSGDENSRLLRRLQNKISGYFQFRQDALIADRQLFRGAGAGGTGQRPSVNGPSVGGPSSGFLVRRGRIRIGDSITPKDEFVFQLDIPTNAEVNVRDAFVRVLDFPARNFALRAGQFAIPYGFEYLYSSRSRESPERALGFSDSTQAGLIFKQSVSALGGEVTPGSIVPFFLNQDRDIGVEVAWGEPRKRGMVPRAAVALIQGEGRSGAGQRALNNVYDVVASVEMLERNKPNPLSLGLSYYRGALSVRGAAPEKTDTGSNPVAFTNAMRIFGGAYVRYQTHGQEYRAEYSGGLYEVTPDRAQYLKDNRFSAWYVVTRQPIVRALEGYLKYDEYNPTTRNAFVAGVRGSDLSRKTLSVGLLYQYTSATRFRIIYAQGMSSFDPSRPAGDPLHGRVGLLQTEIQVVY